MAGKSVVRHRSVQCAADCVLDQGAGVMSTITIPANTLEAGDTVRISGVVRVEAEAPSGPSAADWQWAHVRIVREIERARARHEKRLRKPLLSGRYGKRRRQRAQGVARMRHMKREHSRRWLAMVKAATYPAAVVKGGDDV